MILPPKPNHDSCVRWVFPVSKATKKNRQRIQHDGLMNWLVLILAKLANKKKASAHKTSMIVRLSRNPEACMFSLALQNGGLSQAADCAKRQAKGAPRRCRLRPKRWASRPGCPRSSPRPSGGRRSASGALQHPCSPRQVLRLREGPQFCSRYLLRKKFYRAVGAPDEEALVCAISERPQIMIAFCIEVGLLSKLAEKKLQCIKLPRLCSTAKP